MYRELVEIENIVKHTTDSLEVLMKEVGNICDLLPTIQNDKMKSHLSNNAKGFCNLIDDLYENTHQLKRIHRNFTNNLTWKSYE